MQIFLKSPSRHAPSNWIQKLAGDAPSGRMLRLAALLVACAFAWGGSARSDVASLEILRPLAIIALGLALFTIRGAHIRNYRAPLGIALACIALLAFQLVPLPPELGNALAGRGLVAEIDGAIGLNEVWRPLTQSAPATQNSLWGLLVPLSMLAIGVQLAATDHARLLLVILAVGATSAVVALLQTLGDPQGALYLYDITNFGSAVGLFANRNHQAVFLACLIPLILAAVDLRKSRFGPSGMAHKKGDSWLISAVGAVAFLAALILITGSRSGLLAGVIALFSLAALLPTAKKFTGSGGFLHSRKVQLGLGVALIGALTLATVWLERDLAIERILDRDQGEGMRSLILPAMRDMIWLYRPWGIGLGAFRDVYEVNEPAKLLMGLHMNQAHNDWLDIALTGGLTAIGIAAVAIGAWLVRARQIFLVEAPDQFNLLRKAGLIVLLILAFSSLFDYPTRTPALACLFVLAAIGASLPIERVVKGKPSGNAPLSHQHFASQGN